MKTESEGALKIYSKAEEDEKVQKYMDSLLKDEDVEKLVDQVQSDYTKVQEEDEELKEFLEGLGAVSYTHLSFLEYCCWQGLRFCSDTFWEERFDGCSIR